MLSRPLWPRGLKLYKYAMQNDICNVAALVAAWIEIFCNTLHLHYIGVAALVAAWIEIGWTIYADFAIKRSYILQIIKEMGVELNIRNWHEMRIEYEDQEANTRISEFISDFELLDSQFRDEIKSLFENNYGLKFNQSEPENEDFNKDGE